MTEKRVTGLGRLPQAQVEFPDPDKGYYCPCCNSFLKRYRRRLNANMAVTMVAMFRKKKFGFIRVEEFMRVNGYQRSGDFPYLVHWGMLEKMPGKREDGSSKTGYYKLTDKGRQFVLHQITAQQTLVIYNGKVEGFEGSEISIEEALGKKFDYRELMGKDLKIWTV